MYNKNLFNIILERYKVINSYDCECTKNSNEDLLCNKIQYKIVKFPIFIFILFDFNCEDLKKSKTNILNLVEGTLVLNLNIEYNLEGIIASPYNNHFISIIFNPRGIVIDKKFNSNLVYYHDGAENNGNIVSLNNNFNWKSLGIPYILIYKLKE